MALVDHRPRFTLPAAAEILRIHYGLEAALTPLPGERDQNVLACTPDGRRFVLKIANPLEDAAFLQAQTAALRHLADTGLCPGVVPTLSGAASAVANGAGNAVARVRLVSYIPGRPLATVRRRTGGLWEDLGRQLGRLDRRLLTFDDSALHRTFQWNLAEGLRVVREGWPQIAGDVRDLVIDVADRVERVLESRESLLRRSAIHADANDHNVIVSDHADLELRHQRVAGIIDFGDMIHGWTVGEPAIAAAYAMLDDPSPIDVASAVVQGFHREFPLTGDEIAMLFPLALLRLAMSACIAADQQRRQPDDEYLAVSQAPIRRTLPRLARIPWQLAEARLRLACGLPGSPESGRVAATLNARTSTFGPLLGLDARHERATVIDQGVASALLAGDSTGNGEPALTARIRAHMERANARLGIGPYGEVRYLSMPAAVDAWNAGHADHPTEPSLREQPTVHLGLDLFAPAGTAVHAPLHGVVHAFADGQRAPDGGAVIILEHAIDDLGPFFTLYGRVSALSFGSLRIGQPVTQGEPFTWIAEPQENGGRSPHLHFQLVTDLLGFGTAFPRFCTPGMREVWEAFSPDPHLIAGLPRAASFGGSPKKEETLASRRARLGRNLSVAYDEPLKMLRGWMQYLFDDGGRRFLDAYNNVPHVGHSHPRVVEAGCAQMAVLNTNTRYLHDLITRYAERLASTLPAPLRVCFFVNSASEANELALRLARTHTGRRDVVVLDAAYHGHTTSLIDISPYKHNGPGGSGAPSWVHAAPLPDVFRGPYRADDGEAGRKYASHVREIVQRLGAEGRHAAAFIAETCPSVAGQIMLPREYLPEVYRDVRHAGGVCIADEVQTGYGRIGTHFWAFEAHDVVPDIVVLGKSIGNGHPIGAVVTTPEIAASFDNGMEFFSTYGGNPVSCAIGLAVLDVVIGEDLQAHAREVGARLMEQLSSLAGRFALVGDVRGSGLFIGLELVRDRETLEPAAEEASFIVNRMRELGILVGTDGPFHNVIKIRPPMPFTHANGATLVATLEEILDADFDAAETARL